MWSRLAGPVLAALLLMGAVPAPAGAMTIEVAPGGDGLVRAVAAAAPGDVLHLAPGLHTGPIVVDKALTIEGESFETTTVTGSGEGSVFRVLAANVTIRGLYITGSGTDSSGIDAGIYVEQGADDPVIERNWLDGNLFGITLHGPKRARVVDNKITNRSDLWLNSRGNGIHAWNSFDALVAGNDIRGGRDGLFIQLGRNNVISGNRFEHLRFAIHFMYSKEGSVTGNVSIGNHVGYALMYSDRLKVSDNISVWDRDNGLMLNSARKADVRGNYIYGSSGKCLFLYLALENELRDNRFESCEIGVHVTGSDANLIADNAFIANHTQMHYSGTKMYEWSVAGRGNYWSDNSAFDLDGDGVADTAYRPNNVVDWIVWRYPLAKLLLSSPAMELLRVAQGQFPALYPGGVVDSFPLMAPKDAPLVLPVVAEPIEWEPGGAGSGS